MTRTLGKESARVRVRRFLNPSTRPEQQLSSNGESQPRKHETTAVARPCRVPVELDVWNFVNLDLGALKHPNQAFWWRQHAGKSLAILLHYAGYPREAQYRDLKFFAQVVALYLGPPRDMATGQTPWWPSFMTDDGTPVELSWDWGSRDSPPMVRYSVEPIGMNAGTRLDPSNLLAGPSLLKQILCSLPTTRLEWFDHFNDFFNSCHGEEESRFFHDSQDHNSSIFYAFDLSPIDGITAKVYFFPKMTARQRKQSNLETLFQAIQTAPHCSANGLKAAALFGAFCSDRRNRNLEHEMLAIDLVDPLESRLKIYFRCRETSFDSVVNVMTLGGRIGNQKLQHGLQDLRRLWNAVFSVDDDDPDSKPLGDGSEHRTAGMLYNVEFRVGDAYPVAKIYMPVRHYARSDEAVIRGLDLYFRHHHRGSYMRNYTDAMNTLL